MITNNAEAVVISDNALDLLYSFYKGVDKVVYAIAEEHARKRQPGSGVVEIEPADVQSAAQAVFQALESLTGSDEFKSMLREELKHCFDEKTCSQ